MQMGAEQRVLHLPIKGRGAITNRGSRFEAWARAVDATYLESLRGDGEEAVAVRPVTQVREDPTRHILSRNQSPDVPFDRSLNSYRGCEHGCIYCYARPTHAYLGHSPGLDFETLLYAKPRAAELLRQELSKPGYQPGLLGLGANTDPYQPIERQLHITRSVLEVLAESDHPVCITTKSALVERDLDILAPMARRQLVQVYLSINTLDHQISRTLEPRATAPLRRMEAVRRLAEAGIPVGVMVAPMIPALTDRDMEKVLEAAAAAGARHAAYVVLRLPLEVRDLFVEWLEAHYPLRAQHVMNRVRDMRQGKDYDARFSIRMQGTGWYAELLAQRFALACQRLGLNRDRLRVDLTQFRRPAGQAAASRAMASAQMSLF